MTNDAPCTFVKFSKGSVVNHEMPEIKEFLEKQARNVHANPRFFASVRSTNGNCRGMVGSAEEEFRKCCEASFPIHLIWGKADTSVPYESCCTLRNIAEEMGTAVTEDSFDDMPHNVFFADAKPKECKISICSFVKKIFEEK